MSSSSSAPHPGSALSSVPIRVKLTGMLLLVASLVLIAACVSFVVFDRHSTLETKERTMHVLGDVMGQTLAGPVAFGDKSSAEVVLKNLESEVTAQFAAVYVGDGTRLAAWTSGTEPVSVPERFEEAQALDPPHAMVVVHPIEGPQGPVGQLVVQFSTRDVRARLYTFLTITAAVGVGSLLLAVALAGRLRRVVTDPVDALAEAARRVCDDTDYSTRVRPLGGDELGRLGETFNTMLQDIQERDAQLLQHQANLEALVAQRTLALSQRNEAMKVVMDNVDQGFITLDRSGAIGPECSAAFLTWFGDFAPGTTLAQHLGRLDPTLEISLEIGFEMLLEDFMPREVCLAQLPSRLSHAGRIFTLDFKPLDPDDQPITGVLVVISDVTAQRQAEAAAAEQQELVAAFSAAQEDLPGFRQFLDDGDRILAAIAEADTMDPVVLQRTVHTLKGNAGLLELAAVPAAAHDIESALAEGEPITTAQLDALDHAWRTYRDRILPFLPVEHALSLNAAELSRLQAASSDVPAVRLLLHQLTGEAIAPRLAALARRAQGTARDQGLDVEVSVDAGELRLPPGMDASFFAPLSHVVRNALSHGIEPPDVRRQLGKRSTARLSLAARIGAVGEIRDARAQHLGHRPDDSTQVVAIDVSDDGRGIDWSKVADKARSAGLPAQTRQDLLRALFSDGVSTAEGVTELAGRGVGTSAVAAAADEAGGFVEVWSEPGAGTRFTLCMPLGVPASPQRTDTRATDLAGV